MIQQTDYFTKQKHAVLFFVAAFVLGAFPSTVMAQKESRETKMQEYRTLDLISNIDSFNINDERLRLDAARAHYNMGNIYYNKGEYEIAAREYYQAVTLMPNDPDSHFNLAFVSGKHLRDFKTALKHYRMYLYLNPNAKDRAFVNEQILHAELEIRAKVDSVLNEEARK